MMLERATHILAALMSVHSPQLFVEGHGYLESPRSRNFYASEVGPSCSGAGCPPAEYCRHCLNTNLGVCGKFDNRNYETANWIDKNGDRMPWISQAGNGNAMGGEYVEGGTIVVNSYLATHHNGHMEIRACVMDDSDSAKCTTPEEFEGNELHFLQDLIHPNAETSDIPMPADPDYPERGMYAGGQGGPTKSFSFLYQLPEGISGEKVLLQWKYATANSCSPPGYDKYFGDHPELPDSFWTSEVSVCDWPYPSDGARSTVDPAWPEQFFNCAEVAILPYGTSSPTTSPKPTSTPTTAKPTISKAPTKSPIVGGTPSCKAEWVDCTYDWAGCCDGLQCTQVDAAGYGRCLVPDMCD